MTKKWTDVEMLRALQDGNVSDIPLVYKNDFFDQGVEHNIRVMDGLIRETCVHHTGLRTGSDEFIDPDFRLTEAGRSKLKSSKAPQTTSKSTVGFDARVYTVMIASPSDTTAERDLVEKVVHRWNSDHSWARQIVLLPIRWEEDAIPQTGADGQNFINSQLVDRADIVIAVFRSRIGGKTPRANSGTEEEIMRAHAREAKVHIYFSEMEHPHDVDTNQLTKLATFRKRIQETALYSTFENHPQLNERIRSALENDVAGFIAQTA
jgi:hypothetical protein